MNLLMEIGHFVAYFALFTGLAGCDDDTTCTAGTEGCPCEEDDSCNKGLTCNKIQTCEAADSTSKDTNDTEVNETDENDTGSTDNNDIDTEDAPPDDFVYEVPLREPIDEALFTADPSAHVFNNQLYVYPSHDENNANQVGDYNMVDYHVYALSTDNEFVDHGVILHLDDVSWAQKKAWAPDAAYRDGTYYFYFPAQDSKGIFRIGAATSDSPKGPFTAEEDFIEGSYSMDPAVFIDDDDQAYMYFGGLWGGQLECWQSGEYVESHCGGFSPFPSSGEALGPRVVRMNDDMLSFDGEPEEISIVDDNGTPLQASDDNRRFFEGAWMHKYDGTYYLSYSTGTSHLIVYATSDNPTGPFTFRGTLLPNHNKGWTTHHSVVEFQDNWYLFYHDNSLSGDDHQRCVKVADLYYENDGSIETVSLR